MSTSRGRSVYWIVGCVVLGLVACLCLLGLVGSGAALIGLWSRQARNLPTPRPQVQSAEPRPASPEAGPPLTGERRDAEAMRDLLALAMVPVADPVELAERLGGVTDIPRVLAESAEPIPVGTVDAFWVSNDDTGEVFQLQAELVYATEHAYLWIEQGVYYTEADAQALLDTFEEHIYPTTRTFFGSEWTPGVDGDPHIYILFARGLGSWVAGFFWSNDEFSPLVHEYSNGHEMFYISADGQSLRSDFTYGVLAHEFQHMIHWNLDRNEENWLEEGLSDLASFINGYDVGGWDSAYAAAPDLPLTYWPSGDDSGIHYGQSFLFAAYFLDRFGSEATQALVRHPGNGLDSMDQVLADLGLADPDGFLGADQVYRDFAAAMVVLDPSVEDGRYSLESYAQAPRLMADQAYRSCPEGPDDFEVNQYGIDVIALECEGELRIEFEAQELVQVIPADPHQGDWAFWSNRGNYSDMRLTRGFDLRQAIGPIDFAYWVWYDIEEDWDYAYVEVSTDNGASWEIVETPSGTRRDPNGASYGWAYTGFSGGSSGPRWIEERIDLSDFAGHEILIRFEYVTDASVNGNGLLLDAVAIPQIGYFEGFESGDGGWEAEGFVRLYNRLPQAFQVVLVEMGAEPRVRSMELDESNHGTMEVHLGEGYDEAYLIVIAATRHSWELAPYRIAIGP